MKTDWWKEAIMYQIYPRSFYDSNGDGVGDIRGIITKLDYIQSLGVDVIWLGPVYDSPNKDNGYDIADYYSIHPEFGTMADFDELLEGIHDRGMKLIMDLVVNHTSDQHNWFRESRASKDNPYRDYYIWKDPVEGGPPTNWLAYFGGSTWSLDEHTNQYYLHYFLDSQPDLNWENPQVREEVYKNMKWWLDKGIDGFRMDVISLISKQLDFPQSPDTNLIYLAEHYYANGPRVHEYLQEMHREVLSKYDIMTVGEGPGITKELANNYIGKERNELNMIFQLDAMFIDHGPGGKMDVIQFDLVDFKNIMNGWEAAIGDEGWNNVFLDNHDFPRMVSRFGNDKKYRVEATKLLLTYTLCNRGTPCIYQGSEIGMTNVAYEDAEDYRDAETVRYIKENGWNEKTKKAVYWQGRDNARTGMQWSSELHGGFSSATPWIKTNPNYIEINVAQAEKEADSILHYFRRLTKFRKEHRVLTYGSYRDVLPEDKNLCVYERKLGDDHFVIALNFSDMEQNIDHIDVKGELLLSNYSVASSEKSLRPWEARVIRKPS